LRCFGEFLTIMFFSVAKHTTDCWCC
jgi:hypothetical protein